MKKGASIRIGTSGWTYDHWQERFYPLRWPKSKWLEYYTRHFSTVELNASFYRLPSRKTFEKWKTRTPDNFLWSVKGSKFITHTKRLKDTAESLKRLYDTSAGLGSKRGVILFQLPPNLVFPGHVFKEFCQLLDPQVHHALEIRHPSWIDHRVFGLLSDYNLALCMADSAGRYPLSETITADFVYIRLHGSQTLYASAYAEEELQMWAQKIQTWNRDTFVYFDNDFEGHAVNNAKRLIEILDLE